MPTGDYSGNSNKKGSNKNNNKRTGHGDTLPVKFILDKINVGIIQELVNNGDIKSSEISAKLKIPISTIQRRRNNLEKLSIIKKNYIVDLKKLDLRIAEIMIGTSSGESQKIMTEVYNKHKTSIVDMSLRIGNPDTNVSLRIAYKTSLELFEILEEIKQMDTVNNVTWSEYISEKCNDKSSFDELLRFN
ncbi:MAG: winged helix-turn-helix transcriptional regulator [Candidatus Nitrosocosmicus sp.]|jgi:DNA-binding Lrp family transcriptional regulator|nr:Lrp/AsnC family transcriptional regulator [Candidatus Nitrosocosmicus sp.]